MIASFLTWLGDAAMLATFAVAALLSLMIATWWGELAGIRPHRDKSGLGGFAAIYLLLAMRWLLLAPLVFVGASPFVAWPWILLGHTLLGIASVLLFGRGLALVQQDRFVPLWLGLLGALVLPAPALWFGADVVRFACFDAPLVPVLGLLGLHAWGFWQRRRERFRPDPAPAPSEVVDTDRGGR